MQLLDDPEKVRFGRFLFDLRRRRLLHDGEPVELGGRALDILRLLALAEGAVVSKDELMTRLWPGRTVAENNLHVHISALRKALDEHGESDTYIITVPGRGYRFIGRSSRKSGKAPWRRRRRSMPRGSPHRRRVLTPNDAKSPRCLAK